MFSRDIVVFLLGEQSPLIGRSEQYNWPLKYRILLTDEIAQDTSCSIFRANANFEYSISSTSSPTKVADRLN